MQIHDYAHEATTGLYTLPDFFENHRNRNRRTAFFMRENRSALRRYKLKNPLSLKACKHNKR